MLKVVVTLERSTGSQCVTTLEGDEAAKWERYIDETITYLRERDAYPPFEKLKWSTIELRPDIAARSLKGKRQLLAKRIAQRAFNMKSNQDIVEAAALSVLSESPTSAGDEVERAMQELREMFPGKFIRVRYQDEQNYDETVDEAKHYDQRAFVMILGVQDFRATTLTEVMQAVREFAGKEKS